MDRPVCPLLLEGTRFFRLADVQYEERLGRAMPGQAFVERLRNLITRIDWANVWLVPSIEPGLMARPQLLESLVSRLTSPDSNVVGVSTGLVGAGGFGKTVLAKQVCHDGRIRTRFRDAVWITIGERTTGAALAEKVNDVYFQLSRERPALSDPEQAGLRLGVLLDGRSARFWLSSMTYGRLSSWPPFFTVARTRARDWLVKHVDRGYCPPRCGRTRSRLTS